MWTAMLFKLPQEPTEIIPHFLEIMEWIEPGSQFKQRDLKGINELFQNGFLQEHGNLENFISFLCSMDTLPDPGFEHVFWEKNILFEIFKYQKFLCKTARRCIHPLAF